MKTYDDPFEQLVAEIARENVEEMYQFQPQDLTFAPDVVQCEREGYTLPRMAGRKRLHMMTTIISMVLAFLSACCFVFAGTVIGQDENDSRGVVFFLLYVLVSP